MTIENQIKEIISKAISDTYQINILKDEIKLTPTKKEFEGTYTFTTFPIAKLLGKNPEILGAEIGNFLISNCQSIEKYNVVKGFLNLHLSNETLSIFIQNYLNQPQIGQLPSKMEKVMVEFASPNTNKPLHLGHLRNIFLGDSVSSILKAAGYEVVKSNLINDRGIHICKSMLAYLKIGNSETPQSSGLKGDKLVGKYYVAFDLMLKKEQEELKNEGWTLEEIEKKSPLLKEAQQMLQQWEDGNESIVRLWKTMNGWVYDGFDKTYQSLDVNFDKIYYESNTYLLGKEVVEEGLKNEVFYRKSDNSVWIDLTNEGLDQKLVLRSDGTSVYITQDLGTADLKYKDFGSNKSVYVVGNEQDYHFVVLQHILKKLNRPYSNGIFHLSYGMVDLPSGKMKSREGTVVDADDLIDEMIQTAAKMTEELGKIDGFSTEEADNLYRTIGVGALKYYLIKVDPKKRMLFNPSESIDFHGHTGPFIQYTYARICAILRKAKSLNISYENISIDNYVWHPTERAVLTHLIEFEKCIQQAADFYSPAIIAQYVYDLAKLYNSFYAERAIFNQEEKITTQYLIAFSDAVSKTIAVSMKLLGIKVPERM
jgi:arginyl-tRNA synthetase